MTFDLVSGSVTKATPLTFSHASSPIMTMLTHAAPMTDVTVIETLTSESSSKETSSGHSLFTASFDEDKEADVTCDFDFILESMHIAFMQQEALRFEQNSVQVTELQATQEETSRRLSDNDFSEQEGFDESQDGDDESFDN